MLKASLIQRFLQGDDVSSEGTTDVNPLALSGTAASNLDPILSFDGRLPETLVGVTVDTTAPTTTSITQIRQIQPITIDNGGSAEISGASSQAVTFEGATGTLKLDDAPAFTGHISGLTGADAIDLAAVGYGANTRATFSGNADGGTLTVTNGTQTANIALLGNYLTSGWTLSGDGHGGTVVVDPTSTFPNATNTGVPASFGAASSLPIYTGPTNITTNGTVISGYQITSPLTISANNVTIENCYFPINGTAINISYAGNLAATFNGTNVMTLTSGSGLAPGMEVDPNGPTQFNDIPFGTTIVSQTSGTPGGPGTYVLSNAVPAGTVASFTCWPSGTLITHSEFSDTASGNSDQAIEGGYFTATYNNVHGYCKDFNVMGSGVTLQYNYMWNEQGGGHAENINLNGGGENFNFSNNTIVNQLNQTAAIFITDNFGPVNNVTINGNLIVGGDYTLYAGVTDVGYSSPPITNTFVTNNILGNAAALTGGYGYEYIGSSGGPPTTWTGNVDLLTGQIIAANNFALGPNPNIVIASFTPTNSFTPGSSTFGQNIATANVITLTGSTLANDPVDVYDGTTLLGTTTTNSAGVWTYTTPTLAQGVQAFTAMDPVAGKTSAVFDVTVDTVAPAAPVISSDAVSASAVTLTGTGEASSTVTVFNGTTQLGTATVNGSGAWSFPTGSLANGHYSFTAIDTDAAGNVSAASSPLNVTVNAPGNNAPVNLVTNGGFETDNFTGWTLGGNYQNTTNGQEIFITNAAESGSYAAAMGSVNSDGTLGQTLQTTAGQQYTLSFWLENQGGGPNDFTATWNGTPVLALANAPGQGYTEYSFTVTATGSTSTLQFAAEQNPSQWNLDNISVTAVNPPSGPTLNSVTESPSSGDFNAGNTVMLTLAMSENVTVNTAGGTPTLALNDGGTATYVSGSGSNALTFSYTVGASDSNVASLSATTINLNGATIQDGAGNAANLSLTGLTQTGPQIDTTIPAISSIAETPSSGDLNAGKVVTYTIGMSENVTVNTAGGSPTLALNDGGTATYTSGSGTSTLTFSYTVAAGQNTPDLKVTGVNLNGATISDGAGTAANLSLTGLAQGSPQIDTTPPAAPVISSDAVSASAVTLTGTGEASSTVTVFNGTTQLGTATVNGSGAWSFPTGSLANGNYSFTATDTDAAGNVSAASSPLNVTVNAPGNNAPLNLVTNGSFETDNFTGWTLGGNYQNTTNGQEIFITQTAESGSYAAAMGSVYSDGTLSQTLQTTAGQQYTLSFWLENQGGGPNDFTATWNGTPVLALKNASAQGYTEYSYTVTATGSTSTLEFAAEQNPSQWNLDNVSVTAVNPSPGPTLNSVTESPSSGDLNAGKTVTYTIGMSENVTVNTAGGTPTLALNDGGTATYVSGSGSNALTFSYTVGASDSNVASLSATTINLNGATIQDGAGNAANLSLTGLTQTGPQIDTTTPVISSIAETPSSGDLNAGKVVTYTIGMSENVTVNTAGGSPTLALNDGGTATYTSGSATSTLTFSYTVAAGQNTPDLKVTGVNLNGATISDGAGTAANLSLTGLTQGSPQIDTTAPTVSSVAATAGDYKAGSTLSLTLNMSENVTVNTTGGKPTLTLNDGATATYVSGSGTSALTFSYTVAAGQNTPDLMVTAVNPNGATILDGAGNAANLSLTGLTQAGPQIDTVAPSAPVISSDVISTNVVTLTGTAAASSTVTVFNGTTQLGMATVNSSGAWSFATGSLANGNYSFTATDTDAAGNISAASSPLNVTVNAVPVNLVTNGTFETDNFSGWTLGGNFTSTRWGPEIFITSQAESGSYAAAMGSVNSNGTLSQTLQTTAGQQYTLSFWLANDSGGPNDFTATWNGIPVLALTNAPGQRYTEYTYIVTATGSTSTLQFAAEQNPTQWNLDNVSVTAGVNAAPGTTLRSSVSMAGPATIGTGATLELAAADSGSVTFLGSTGTLRLDHSSTFTGKISNFTGNGSLSGSDQIDLKDVKYSTVHDSYANGVLTVTDGTDTAKLTFNGSYTLANFKLANDGSGGTIVYDPPAPTPSSQNIAASGSPIGEATSSFMFSPNVALLGNYIASAFAEANDGHNGNLLATEASSPSDQSLLSNPHHA